MEVRLGGLRFLKMKMWDDVLMLLWFYRVVYNKTSLIFRTRPPFSAADENGRCIDAELFEDDEPSGVDEAKFLTDYLHRCSLHNQEFLSHEETRWTFSSSLSSLSVRFIELFDSAQYEDAALLAARSPRGVLRNLDTMEMFKGVRRTGIPEDCLGI